MTHCSVISSLLRTPSIFHVLPGDMTQDCHHKWARQYLKFCFRVGQGGEEGNNKGQCDLPFNLRIILMILWVGLVSWISTALRYNRNFITKAGQVTESGLGSPGKGRAGLSSARSWVRARQAALKPCWLKASPPPGQDVCVGESQGAAAMVSFLTAEAVQLWGQLESWNWLLERQQSMVESCKDRGAWAQCCQQVVL